MGWIKWDCLAKSVSNIGSSTPKEEGRVLNASCYMTQKFYYNLCDSMGGDIHGEFQFRMHEHFIWGAIPMPYLCRICVVMMSNLPYHVIIFLKLLISPYRTHTHNYTYTPQVCPRFQFTVFFFSSLKQLVLLFPFKFVNELCWN